MKFNSSILFYFIFVLMAMLICAQAQETQGAQGAQAKGCRIKVYRPRQGSTYQFYSWQYVEYDVSGDCIKGGRDSIDVGIVNADGEKVLDVARNGHLDTTPKKLKYWIDPSWANDGGEYYIGVTINKRTRGKSGYFTTYNRRR